MRIVFYRHYVFHVIMAGCLLASCSSATQVAYLQDIQPNVTVALQEPKPITLQPGDKLDIMVHSRDSELADMFNITANRTGGHETGYTVDEEGKIDMPILGPITVEGLTRLELAKLIKYRLVSGKLVRDPVVTVEYANLCFSVLGEVNSPGQKMIDRDQITLLDALALSGDLTINGRRENILVLRTENGKQTPYTVDITQASNLYASPVYYLKQNDLIYVEPTQMRANQSKLNANSARTPSFWFSVSSMVMSIILFLTR